MLFQIPKYALTLSARILLLLNLGTEEFVLAKNMGKLWSNHEKRSKIGESALNICSFGAFGAPRPLLRGAGAQVLHITNLGGWAIVASKKKKLPKILPEARCIYLRHGLFNMLSETRISFYPKEEIESYQKKIRKLSDWTCPRAMIFQMLGSRLISWQRCIYPIPI